MIRDQALREYADLLLANGFTIYEPKNPYAGYFMYSRMVDGQECFGTVEKRDRPLDHGYEHHMPIKPSQEFGSSMFVEIRTESANQGRGRQVTIEQLDELTVEHAMLTARPENWNSVVGTQKNYSDTRFAHMYIKRTD